MRSRAHERKAVRDQTTAGPAALALAALVARRYYLDGRSKVEIAERARPEPVQDRAAAGHGARQRTGPHRDRSPGLIDVDLAAQIMERFGLKHAVVVDTQDDHAESMRRHLGQVAAELLAEVIGPRTCSASPGPARSARWPGAARSPRYRSSSSPGPSRCRTTTTARSTSCATSPAPAGGPAYVFYAPFTVPDAATGARPAPAERHRPGVRPTLQGHQGRRRTGALGTRAVDALRHAPDHDRRTLTRLGVCAEVSGVFLAADGEPVQTDLTPSG